jgi:hypothetical protein
MCMNLLRALAETPPPCDVSDPVRVDRLRVLQAAGLVDARIPASWDVGSTRVLSAVLAITPHGWEALRKGMLDEPPWPPTWLDRARHASGK